MSDDMALLKSVFESELKGRCKDWEKNCKDFERSNSENAYV
jgi:hypothetical protein